MKKKNSGFTLVEVVVVLAVVAILAAILTPNIVKNINDSKVARANNETQVIAASLASFYKDVGRWPTANGTSTADALLLLVGAGTIPTGVADWIIATTVVTTDTFSNQLLANTPKGVAVAPGPYVTTGELKWNGPYIVEVKADPWGGRYACNVEYLYSNTTNFVGILSAGPDRIVQTTYTQLDTVATKVGGDDILFTMD